MSVYVRADNSNSTLQISNTNIKFILLQAIIKIERNKKFICLFVYNYE